jgi:hypothetical protein
MRTIEVFKTNVVKKQAAKMILKEIGIQQPKYKCNFDLEDCDKILRVESENGIIDSQLIFTILEKNNQEGTVLE